MTTIYRVQDRQGRGPFRPGFTATWLQTTEGKTMSWQAEFGLDITKKAPTWFPHFGTGCLEPHQLRRWFTEKEHYLLTVLEFRAVKLEVDLILASSERQCVFCRSKPLYIGAEPFDLYSED